MKSKKLLIVMIILGVLLIGSIVFLFVFMGGQSSGVVGSNGQDVEEPSEIGIGNPDNIMEPEDEGPITSDDLQEEYEERPTYNDTAASQLEANIEIYLSEGDFSGLDSYLQEMDSRFSVQTDENSPDDVTNYTLLIANVRADIAMYNSIDEYNGEMMFQQFTNPTACAAAVIYTDIREKMDGFVDLDSKIYNAVEPGSEEAKSVNLRASDMTDSERGDKLVEVNSYMDEQNQFVELRAYDCTIHTVPYRIYVVQNNFGRWQPYGVESLAENGEDDTVMTIVELQQLRDNDPYFDFDNMDYDIIKDGGSGTPGAIDRENYDPGLGNDPVDPEDPNATEDPSQTDPGTETTDPGVIDPGTTETPSTDPGDLSQLSQADQQVLADLQKIMDSFDVNTTSLQVIQGTIDQVKALASRDGISPEMSQILNDSVADLQAKYDELDAILNG